jgi:hypothetical protein
VVSVVRNVRVLNVPPTSLIWEQRDPA